jgi:hypothetical protein
VAALAPGYPHNPAPSRRHKRHHSLQVTDSKPVGRRSKVAAPKAFLAVNVLVFGGHGATRACFNPLRGLPRSSALVLPIFRRFHNPLSFISLQIGGYFALVCDLGSLGELAHYWHTNSPCLNPNFRELVDAGEGVGAPAALAAGLPRLGLPNDRTGRLSRCRAARIEIKAKMSRWRRSAKPLGVPAPPIGAR